MSETKDCAKTTLLLGVTSMLLASVLSFCLGLWCGGTNPDALEYRRLRQMQEAAIAAGVGYFDRGTDGWNGRGDFHFGTKPTAEVKP